MSNISPFQVDADDTYKCGTCGKIFDTKRAASGHYMGAHTKRRVRRGNEHHAWKTIEHGTNKGYQQEIRRGIPRCKRCMKAHAVYTQTKYVSKKEKKK